MREVKNNVEIGKTQPQPKIDAKIDIKPETKPEDTTAQTQAEAPIKDFSNPSEVLGRSQVASVDALDKDVKFGMKNPDAIKSADRFFDIAYNQLIAQNDPQAYEKACTMTSLFVEEVHK